jgi:hypothetical protein
VGARQAHDHHRPVIVLGCIRADRNGAAVFFDQLLCDSEVESGAAVLSGCKKRIEYVGQNVRRHAASVVRDDNLDVAIRLTCADMKLAAWRAGIDAPD